MSFLICSVVFLVALAAVALAVALGAPAHTVLVSLLAVCGVTAVAMLLSF